MIAMKNLIIPMFIMMLAWSCSSSQKAGSSDKSTSIAIDSTEYEITIIDNEFDLWYQMNYSPAKDYSNEYYRGKNQIGVSNWNNYFNRGRYHRVIENYLYYDNSVDYGIEVNRKLYWYFKFVEENYRLRLFQ
jgi:hypothetical protein